MSSKKAFVCVIITFLLIFGTAVAASADGVMENPEIAEQIIKIDCRQESVKREENASSTITEISAGHGLFAVTGGAPRHLAVEYTEPDYIVELFETDEEYYPSQILDYSSADVLEFNGRDVTIGVIDSGVADHPDYSDNVLSGYNYIDETEDTTDKIGHGSFVCGLIASKKNNGGIIGSAPMSKIVPLKCFDKSYSTRVSCVCRAIYDAVDVYRCDVINMSFGLKEYSRALKSAIDYAYENGVTLVASVGNEGTNTLFYPAAFENVIGVGAIDFDMKRARFSQSNGSVYVVAPGVGLTGADKDGGYCKKSGTSFSAPFVTGIVARLLSAFPDCNNKEIMTALEKGAIDLGEKGKDNHFGFGCVDFFSSFSFLSSLHDSKIAGDLTTAAKLTLSDAVFTSAGDYVTVNLTAADVDFSPLAGLTAFLIWDPARFAYESSGFGPGVHSSAAKADGEGSGKVTFTVSRGDGVLSSEGGFLYTLTLKVLPGAEKENAVTLQVNRFGIDADNNYASAVSIKNATVLRIEKPVLKTGVACSIIETPSSGGVTLKIGTLEGVGYGKTGDEIRSLFSIPDGAEIRFKDPDGSAHDPSKPVGTGTIVELWSGGTMIDSLIVIIKGDGDGNADSDVFDAVALMSWIVSAEKNPLADHFLYALNVDGSSAVDVFDAVSILTYIVKGSWTD